MKRRQLRGFDLRQVEGLASLIGVDEAGRGALAGPVVAGAVLVTREFLDGRWAQTKAGRVNDSKQLTAAEREELWLEFEGLVAQGQIHAHFGGASVDEMVCASAVAACGACVSVRKTACASRRTRPVLATKRKAWPR